MAVFTGNNHTGKTQKERIKERFKERFSRSIMATKTYQQAYYIQHDELPTMPAELEKNTPYRILVRSNYMSPGKSLKEYREALSDPLVIRGE